jgi:multidrug efflux pump subunit AcrA (membrane-fusion protein)
MEFMIAPKKFFWLLVFSALVLAACSPAAPTQTAAATPVPASAVISEGHIFPEKYTALSFLAAGVVKDVNIDQGDQVKQGDVLLRLDNADQAEAQVVAAQQAYDTFLRTAGSDHAGAWEAYMDAQKVREAAQKRWNEVNLRDIENRIEDRTQDLQDRQEDLDRAHKKFDSYKDRGRDDANYKNAEDDLDHAQSDYDEALKNLESTIRERDVPRASLDAALAAEAEFKYQYELGLDGPNAEKLALLKTQLASAQSTLSNFAITAPFDGLVMDLNVSPGDLVNPGASAVKLADTSAWYVKTSDLTELEVVKVAVGQPVSVVPDAIQDLALTGKVVQISQASTVQGGDVLYEVRILLDSLDPRLLWGMTVEVTFEPSE